MFLVSENRGCAAKRYVKQITLEGGYKLTLSVGGPTDRNNLGFYDDTTHIAISGISETGFIVGACQEAINGI